MIQPELLSRLRLLAEAYRLPVSGPVDRVNEVAPPSAMQQVLAEVESRLPDGRFRVAAAGQKFDVLLPPSTQPGDRVRVAIAAGRSPLPQAADAQDDAVKAQVSPAGRFIAAIAERPGTERTPGAIGGTRPLLPDAPLNVPVAAATLRELVALSGLFYESHQAEWVGGERTREALLREPQAKLAPLPPAQPLRTEAAAPPAPPLAAQAAAPQEAPASSTSAIRPEAAPLVQQQLNALEARHVVWSGQIWPGQPMRWELEETDAEAPRAEGESAARAWSSRVELSLPRLGELAAVLTLGATGLQVRLSAADPRTAAQFEETFEDLRRALDAAGLGPASLATVPHGRR